MAQASDAAAKDKYVARVNAYLSDSSDSIDSGRFGAPSDLADFLDAGHVYRDSDKESSTAPWPSQVSDGRGIG